MQKGVFFLLPLIILLLSMHICYAADFGGEVGLGGFLGFDTDQGSALEWMGHFSLDLPPLYLTLGKEQVLWGRGETGTLIFSPTAPALYSISYDLSYKSYRYTHMILPLEQDQNRWLFAHRFDGEPLLGLKIAVWEMMLCSNDIFPAYYIPIPLIPFYLTQKIAYESEGAVYDYNSNAMIGMDFQYQKEGLGKIYGELLIDDFPQNWKNNNPRKVAGLMGVKWYVEPKRTEIWMEYVRINNFVYTHKNPNNRYVYSNKPLGYWLGMDGDVLTMGVNHRFNLANSLSIQVQQVRRGKGDFEDNWNWQYENKYEFLTGIIEHSYQMVFEYKLNLSEGADIMLKTILGRANNADHVENVSRNYWRVNLALDYKLDILNTLIRGNNKGI